MRALPPDARREFLRAASTGLLSGGASPWAGWWEGQGAGLTHAPAVSAVLAGRGVRAASSRPRIETLGGANAGPGGHAPHGPRRPWSSSRLLRLFDSGALPHITSLVRSGAAPRVVATLAELAFATAFTYRLYAGDPAAAAGEALDVLGTVAPCLVTRSPPPAASAAPSDTAAAALALGAAAAAARRAAPGPAGPSSLACAGLSDVGAIALSRRCMVETLARALELVGRAFEEAVTPEDAGGLGARAAAEATLRLPGLKAEGGTADVGGGGGGAAAVPRLRGPLRRAAAAYRKVWFHVVAAGSCPPAALAAVRDGARACHAEATEEGGWAVEAPREDGPLLTASAGVSSAPGGVGPAPGPQAGRGKGEQEEAGDDTEGAGPRGRREEAEAALRRLRARPRRAVAEGAGCGGDADAMD